jgi:hypothetical protein
MIFNFSAKSILLSELPEKWAQQTSNRLPQILP